MLEPLFIKKRNNFYRKLIGSGLEIGAFEHPAKLPENCSVKYCDVITREEAKLLFPEVNHEDLVNIDYIIDLDCGGLERFKDNSQDFIIINHVIEHIFDPVHALVECFRVLKPNGLLVLSVPDKRFTFDIHRPLTSIEKIFTRIKRVPKVVRNDDYLDILEYIAIKDVPIELRSKFTDKSEKVRNELLNLFMSRKEHLNVWIDETFQEFVEEVLSKKKIRADLVYKIDSQENEFEFFGVWKKLYSS